MATPSDDTPASPPTRLVTALLIAVSILALLTPVGLVAIPPLLDYPNHFARFWMIAGGLADGPLSRMYAVDWSRASLNIVGDLIAATLGPLIGRDNVGRLVLAIAILAPSIGGVLLHRRIHGRFTPWQVAFSLPAWSVTLLDGFMNFHIGLGAALLFAVLDRSVARTHALAAFAIRALLCAVVLVCHPFGALFYCGLLTALSYGAEFDTPRDWPSLRTIVLRLIPPIGACVTPIVLLILLSHSPLGEPQAAPMLQWAPFTVAKKVAILSSGLRSYTPLLDGLAIAMVLAIPLAALLRRSLSLHAGMLVLTALLTIAAVCMPTKIGGTFAMDYRLPIMALIAFLLAVDPRFLCAPRLNLVVGLGLGLLSLGRTGLVTRAWQAGERDVEAVRRAVAPIPPGAAMVTVMNVPTRAAEHGRPWRYPAGKANFWNFETLVVPWRQAFAPNVFSQVGQQPLRVLPPWYEISTPYGPPLRIKDLYVPPRDPAFAYARRWRDRFDYLLLINADMPDAAGRPLPTQDLERVADQGFAVLYRIKRPTPKAAAPA